MQKLFLCVVIRASHCFVDILWLAHGHRSALRSYGGGYRWWSRRCRSLAPTLRFPPQVNTGSDTFAVVYTVSNVSAVSCEPPARRRHVESCEEAFKVLPITYITPLNALSHDIEWCYERVSRLPQQQQEEQQQLPFKPKKENKGNYLIQRLRIAE